MAEVVETIQAGLIKVDVVLDEPTKKIWDEAKNTKAYEADQKAWDDNAPGARWHRKEAQRLIKGKKGLSDEDKVVRMQRAVKHLNAAINMMETGEI